MKRIGLMGGMSWESSLEYYRIMNEEVKRVMGKTHSANCIMYSFDFYEIEHLQHQGKWDELTGLMVDEAMNLKCAGAQVIIICTNTMHLMAEAVQEGTGLDVLHIAHATGQCIKDKGLKKVALLGTKFTMESDFYKDILRDNYAIDVIIPNDSDRQVVHDIIYKELILGVIREESRHAYVEIIERLAEKGAEGVILGCTEIPLLIQDDHVSVEVFDTTEIHAKAAVSYALEE